MSLITSMYSGTSGMSTNSQGLSVTGDNIANVNTVGFKEGRANFQDMLAETVHGGAGLSQIGRGSLLGNVQQIFSQGALINTGSVTDLAITGHGFFVVNGTVNGVSGDFYTRAGQFNIDADGYLVNPNNLRVQGYGVDDTGQIAGGVGDIALPTSPLPANATTTVDLSINLDSREAVTTWDPTDPVNSSNFSTSATVYDTLGNAHRVDVYFSKTADNTWDYHAMVDGADIAGGTPGVLQEIDTGTLTFGTDGSMTNATTTPTAVTFAGGAGASTIGMDFGIGTAGGGTGFDGATQFADESAVITLAQDGYSTGTLQDITIDADGEIEGLFSNGEHRLLGQVALASFQNENGLQRAGNSLWLSTDVSGDPAVGVANTGGRGTIYSNSLEQSNVDLAKEFVNMIAYQRGFQANSRTITTASDMLNEVVNIKR